MPSSKRFVPDLILVFDVTRYSIGVVRGVFQFAQNLVNGIPIYLKFEVRMMLPGLYL